MNCVRGTFLSISSVHCNDTRILCTLQQVSGQTVGWKQTQYVGARQSAVAGRQHSSLIGFGVAADIHTNAVDIYFPVWSLSGLLCCVSSPGPTRNKWGAARSCADGARRLSRLVGASCVGGRSWLWARHEIRTCSVPEAARYGCCSCVQLAPDGNYRYRLLQPACVSFDSEHPQRLLVWGKLLGLCFKWRGPGIALRWGLYLCVVICGVTCKCW